MSQKILLSTNTRHSADGDAGPTFKQLWLSLLGWKNNKYRTLNKESCLRCSPEIEQIVSSESGIVQIWCICHGG